MSTTIAADEIQGIVPAPEPADADGLRDVRLSPPLVAALTPWWISLPPAAVALGNGRPGLAALLAAAGAVLSTAAVVGVLLFESRTGE